MINKNFFKKNLIVQILLSAILVFSSMGSSMAATGYERVSGYDRTQTSVKAANKNNTDTLVVAPGDDFADILSATNLVNRYSGKLVLHTKDSGVGEVDTSNIHRVYVVVTDNYKAEKMISDVEKKLANRIQVSRIGGSNKYETNKNTLLESGYKTVGIANGENYPDALSAYSFLKERGLGLMLVNGKDNYSTNGLKVAYTFGGPSSVKYSLGQRIYGADRYETSINIAKETKFNNICFVSGDIFADAMSAINITNSNQADILLAPKSLKKDVMELTKQAYKIYAVGGIKVLSDDLVKSAINGKYIQKSTDNKKPTSNNSNNGGALVANHESKLFKIEIPKKHADKFIIKHEDSKPIGTIQIAIYSKYHYKKKQIDDIVYYEGFVAAFDIGPVNGTGGPGDHVIGTVTKGSTKKGVIYALPTDVTYGDYDNKNSFAKMNECQRIIYDVAKNGVKPINGAKYKSMPNRIPKPYN